MSLLRLDKIISDSGIATRSEARKLITSGKVIVDGNIVTRSDLKFDTETSVISVDGDILNSTKYRYIMLNKPDGVLSATEDREQKTVLDILPPELYRMKLFPVGRLDKDTTGLLILTNDGDFCHAVTSPKRRIKKRYEFTSESVLTAEDAEEFLMGITLRDGTKCLPAELEIDLADPCHGYISVFEGKYHQVKRMLASRGKPVISLKRVAIGNLVLDKALGFGEYREISENEIKQIFN